MDSPAQWLTPTGNGVLIALSGLILGWLVEKLILKRVLASLGTRGWKGEVAIKNAVKGFFTFGLFIAGLFIAIQSSGSEIPVSWRLNLWIKVAFIFFLALYASRSVAALIRYYTGHEGSGIPNSSILVNLARFTVLLIGFVIILNAIGISITPILTALGVGGLAVALALQDTLGNLFAGLQILAARKISVGDFIRLESGDEGQIEDIALRNTTIRTMRNNLVVIPNSKIANSILTNYNAPTEDFTIAIDAIVPFGSDLNRIEKIVLEVGNNLMKSESILSPDYKPSMVFTGFMEVGVGFRVLIRTPRYSDQQILRHRFIKALHARFIQESIEIPVSTPERLGRRQSSV